MPSFPIVQSSNRHHELLHGVSQKGRSVFIWLQDRNEIWNQLKARLVLTLSEYSCNHHRRLSKISWMQPSHIAFSSICDNLEPTTDFMFYFLITSFQRFRCLDEVNQIRHGVNFIWPALWHIKQLWYCDVLKTSSKADYYAVPRIWEKRFSK